LSGKSVHYRVVPVRIENWHARAMEESAANQLIQQVKRLSRIFPKSIFDK
jgi:hypothetical protein